MSKTSRAVVLIAFIGLGLVWCLARPECPQALTQLSLAQLSRVEIPRECH